MITKANNTSILVDDICTIPLDKGLYALIDRCKYDAISQHTWYAKRGSRNTWYAARCGSRPGKKVIFMHDEILGEREGMKPDHKNGNGLDNRLSNLRLATHSQNIANQRRGGNSTSKYKGVRFRVKGGWSARITVKKKEIFLGYFGKGVGGEIEAARAYDRAAFTYFGEFANFNLDYPEGLDVE